MSGIFYCDKAPRLPASHLAIIDGNSIQTSADLLRCIGEQLRFPDAETVSWDACLDWMRDLSWLEEKAISIVILNIDSFLNKDVHTLNALTCFISDFEKVVFPFWQHDAECVFEDPAMVKEITVYCVQGGWEQISTKEIINGIRIDALNRSKTPHSISQPVLHLHEGKLCLASFIFFYNRNQIRSAMAHGPALWVICDLETGKIMQRLSCEDGADQKLYDISAKSLPSISRYGWDAIYAIMDWIRHEYMNSGRLDDVLYNEYLTRILRVTPEAYRIFYQELSL